MGSRVIPANGRAALVGFALPDVRLTFDELQSGSTYTQTGPHPGSDEPASATSQWSLVVSGEQSSTLYVRAANSGLPQPGGAEAIYSDGTSSTSYRGWSPSNFLCNWSAGEYSPSGTLVYARGTPSVATIPSSQKIAVAYNSDTTLYFRLYDPFTNTWGTRKTLSTSLDSGSLTAVCVLPRSERLIVIVAGPNDRIGKAYYSDDDGATWALYADAIFNSGDIVVGGNWVKCRMYAVGDDLVWIMYADNNRFYVFASASQGSTWTRIAYKTGVWRSDGAPLPDGRMLYVQQSTSTGNPKAVVVPSVWDAPDFANATDVGPGTFQPAELGCVVEPSGQLVLYGREGSFWYVWRSDDGNSSWSKSDMGWFTSGNAVTTTYPTDVAFILAGGATWCAHRWNTAVGDEGTASVALAQLGGWANIVSGYPKYTTRQFEVGDSERFAWGITTLTGASTGTMYTHTWLPFDIPSDNATQWSATGAGTASLANDSLDISTTSQTKYYANVPTYATSANGKFLALFDVQVISGGATATNDIAVRVKLSTGSTGIDFVVRFKGDTIRVRDINAGTNYDATVDCTSRVQVFIGAGHNGDVDIAWRRPYSTKWTTIANTAFTLDASVTTCSLQWGHLASSTANSRWRMALIAQDAVQPSYKYADSGTTTLRPLYGRVLTGRPVPLGDTATAGATFLSAIAGPAAYNESHTIEPVYDYGAEKVFWDISPSLAEEWRSTGTTEAVFEWAPSEVSKTTDTQLGSRSLVVGFFGANFQTAYLEADPGTGYVTLGTYNGAIGFDGALTGTVTGDQVTPNTSTTTDGGRYLQRSEMVGAVAVVNGIYCYITRQEEGGWTKNDTRRARLTVDRAASSGAVKIIARNGVLVVHNVTTAYRKFRIRIPSQSTPDGFFRLAGLVVGGLVVPGLPWDWGWSEQQEINITDEVSRRGTMRRKQEGPPRKVLTFSWSTSGAPLYRLRNSLNNDFLSPDASIGAAGALATYKDVPWLMAGLMRDCDSGEVPIIALKVIPETSSSATITDPTHYVYGRLDGSVQYAQVTGKTGHSEYVRVESMTVRELV